MPIVNSRDSLKEYCLRRLGKPVVEVNVSDDQIDDAIDDAIQFFQNYHYDGTQKLLYLHTVTESDVANRYVTLPSNVVGIESMYRYGYLGSGSFFNVEYEIRMSNFDAFYGGAMSGGSLLFYDIQMKNLDMINEYFSPPKRIRFNRNTRHVHIDSDWRDIKVGWKLLFEAFVVVDPEQHSSFYNDERFKQYVVLLIKRQWKENLSKFDGVTLPGGVTLNTSRFDGIEDQIEQFRTEVIDNLQLPPDFVVG